MKTKKFNKIIFVVVLLIPNLLFATNNLLSKSHKKQKRIDHFVNKDSLVTKNHDKFPMGSEISLFADPFSLKQEINATANQFLENEKNPQSYIQICHNICKEVGGVVYKTRDHPNIHPNNCSICCDFPSMCPQPTGIQNCGSVYAFNGEFACDIDPPCPLPARLYRDLDSDGYGDMGESLLACSFPQGYILDNTDCNDNNSSINPNGVDVPNNGIDENCDGLDSILSFIFQEVKDVKVDTTLGTLVLTPIPNLVVKAYDNNSPTIVAALAITNGAGEFKFTTLNINNYYTLKFHYQTAAGIPQNIFVDYTYTNFKPTDTLPDILMPYTALLQTRLLLDSLREKGNYTITYTLIDIANTILDTMNLNTATARERKVYDVAAIDSLLNDWRTIDKIVATDVSNNLGRVYISMYANNQYANDAYRLSALPSRAISELVMGVLEIMKVQEKLNKLAGGGTIDSLNPVQQLAEKAAKSVVSAIIKNTSYQLKLRLATLPDGVEKKQINVLLKALTVGALFLKERPDASIGVLLDLFKEIISNEGFILLYETYLEDSQELIASTYNKASLLAPPDETFAIAYNKVLRDNGSSHVYNGHANADLAIDACSTLFNNVDKLNATLAVTDVLAKYISLTGSDDVKELVLFFKSASHLFTAFKMSNYGTALYLGFSALLDNRLQQGKIPAMSFSPNTIFSNRVASPLGNNGSGIIAARNSSNQIANYNLKLDSIILLIQNNQNTQALNLTSELFDISASLDKNLNAESRNIAAIANKAITAIPEFDSVFTSFTNDFEKTFSYRAAVNFDLAVWFLDTTSATFLDTIVTLANQAKDYNLKVDSTLEIMDSITSIFQVPVRVMISSIDGENEVRQGDTTHITIPYQNFGTDTATQCYISLRIDSAYIVSADSLYLGDIPSGGTGQVSFDIYSPLLDTFAVYSASLIVSNGEGDQENNYIISKTPETCDNGIDDNHNGVIDEACKITLNLKAFIEGYYLGNNQLSPVLDPINKPDVCDSIIVELHGIIAPYELIASSQGIINVQGMGEFSFPFELRNHSYYIVVRHHSTIETWSKHPVTIGELTTYDFTH